MARIFDLQEGSVYVFKNDEETLPHVGKFVVLENSVEVSRAQKLGYTVVRVWDKDENLRHIIVSTQHPSYTEGELTEILDRLESERPRSVAKAG